MAAADEHLGKRVIVYARVSTTRQEKNDLSLPDQIATGDRWIEEAGATKVATYSEAGSATDDERRAFREMIALAESDERLLDIILVHSLSRLFRNALDFMQYRERLRRNKVRIVSIHNNLVMIQLAILQFRCWQFSMKTTPPRTASTSAG